MDKKELLEHIRMIRERCWKGYKPAKGKKPYSKKSCVKEAKDNFMDKFGTGPSRPRTLKNKNVGVDPEELDFETVDPGRDGFNLTAASEKNDDNDNTRMRNRAYNIKKKATDSKYNERVANRLAAGKGLPPSKPPTRSGRPRGRNDILKNAIANVYRPRNPDGTLSNLRRVELPDINRPLVDDYPRTLFGKKK